MNKKLPIWLLFFLLVCGFFGYGVARVHSHYNQVSVSLTTYSGDDSIVDALMVTTLLAYGDSTWDAHLRLGAITAPYPNSVSASYKTSDLELKTPLLPDTLPNISSIHTTNGYFDARFLTYPNESMIPLPLQLSIGTYVNGYTQSWTTDYPYLQVKTDEVVTKLSLDPNDYGISSDILTQFSSRFSVRNDVTIHGRTFFTLKEPNPSGYYYEGISGIFELYPNSLSKDQFRYDECIDVRYQIPIGSERSTEILGIVGWEEEGVVGVLTLEDGITLMLHRYDVDTDQALQPVVLYVFDRSYSHCEFQFYAHEGQLIVQLDNLVYETTPSSPGVIQTVYVFTLEDTDDVKLQEEYSYTSCLTDLIANSSDEFSWSDCDYFYKNGIIYTSYSSLFENTIYLTAVQNNSLLYSGCLTLGEDYVSKTTFDDSTSDTIPVSYEYPRICFSKLSFE